MTKSDQKTSFAILLSIALHGVAYLGLSHWLNWELPWSSQSKGSAQVILLAPSPAQTTPKPGEAKDQKQSKKQDEQKTAEQPKQITTSAPSPLKHSQKQNSAIAPSIHNPVDSQKKVTAAIGDESPIDTDSQEDVKLSPYEQMVLNHLLSKMESAPVTGSATVEMNIMRAGVAINVKIINLKGPKEYGIWLHRKALAANPYPAFKGKESTRTLRLPVNHLLVQ